MQIKRIARIDYHNSRFILLAAGYMKSDIVFVNIAVAFRLAIVI